MQGNLSAQDMKSVSAAGAGVLESMGGSSFSSAFGAEDVSQNQAQSNTANTGDGGDANVYAGTGISV